MLSPGSLISPIVYGAGCLIDNTHFLHQSVLIIIGPRHTFIGLAQFIIACFSDGVSCALSSIMMKVDCFINGKMVLILLDTAETSPAKVCAPLLRYWLGILKDIHQAVDVFIEQ